MKYSRFFFIILLVLVSGCHTNSIEQTAQAVYRSFLSSVVGQLLSTHSACGGADLNQINILTTQMSECEFYKDSKFTPTQENYKECIDNTLEAFNKIQEPGCRKVKILQLKDLLLNNVIHQAKQIQKVNQSDLENSFEHINYWMTKTNESFYQNANNLKLLDNPQRISAEDLNSVLLSIWNQIWKNINLPNAILKQEQAFTNGLPIFTTVIQSAHNRSLNYSLLLPIIEQALNYFYTRVQFFSDLNDFACDLKKCDPDLFNGGSQLSKIHEVFSDLDNPFEQGKSTQIISEISNPAIRDFLKAVTEAADINKDWLKEVSDEIKHISDLPDHETPPFARGYVSIIKAFAQSARSYQNIGRFTPNHHKGLNFGLTTANISETKNHLTRISAELEKTIQSFSDNKKHCRKSTPARESKHH